MNSTSDNIDDIKAMIQKLNDIIDAIDSVSNVENVVIDGSTLLRKCIMMKKTVMES
ncbi:MAG: hypothetical protein ACLS61_18545 [Ruminococcus sp.]